MLGFLKGGAHRHGDEVFAGHHFADEGGLRFGDETHVAVGQNAHKSAVFHHGQAGNAEVGHEVEGVLHRVVGSHGDGIENHAAFGLLDLFHLKALAGDIHVLVDDAYAALTGHGNGHFGFRYGIHGGRDEGYAELDAGSQPCRHVDHVRGDFRIFGNQKDIVECQCLAKHCGHIFLQGWIKFGKR